MSFWNLFKKTYMKPTSPASKKNLSAKKPIWNQAQQIRLSKLISRLNSNKYQSIQKHLKNKNA